MLQTVLRWIDKHGLLFAALFLLVFIPLYPKIPLFDAIPGYLVRVRLEDVLILLIGLFWLVQVWRGKTTVSTSFLGLVAAYAVVGFLSIISGIVLIQTIPFAPLHLGKSVLHYFRYAEYFTVFFFAYSGITALSHIRYVLVTVAVTVMTITAYGYGQLYWHWPLYSTMNREFSKGEKLYLTEHARVQSTFAGHYDLAAYLVLILPVLLSAFLYRKSLLEKALYAVAQIAGVWLLITSGSNIALAAYAVGVGTVVLLFLSRYPILFRIGKVAALTAALVFFSVGSTFYLVLPEVPKHLIQSAEQQSLVQKLPGVPLALRTTRVALYPDTAPPPAEGLKPADVFHDIPITVEVATVSATGEETTILVQQDRTWSDNAIKYGLSMGIRLDTLWPQAIKGWARNLYLGSGYGTLNKQGSQEFTEADSTDNNYLRTLGETGLLGFGVFSCIFIWLCARAWSFVTDKDPLVATVATGILGAVAGLLANAIIIDVFVASKVAFTVWALAGIAVKTIDLASGKLYQQLQQKQLVKLQLVLRRHWPLIIGICVAIFLLHKNPLAEMSATKDLETAPETIETIVTAQCWKNQKEWILCTDSIRSGSNASLMYTGILSIWYSFSNNPASFYYFNLIVALVSVVLVYAVSTHILIKQTLQTLVVLISTLLLFVTDTVTLPVSGNVYMPILLLLLLLSIRRSTALHMLWSTVLIVMSMVALWEGTELLLILGYCVSFVVAFLYEKWLHSNLKPWNTAVLVSVTTTSLLLAFNAESVQHLWNRHILEYSSTLTSLRTQTVARANQFFAGLKAAERWSEDKPRPYLITTLDPMFIDVYGNDLYQPVPLSTQQPFYELSQSYWGGIATESLNSVHQKLLNKDRVFFIDTLAESEPYSADFTQLRRNFTVWQVDIDCNGACNVYELRKEVPQVPTQPDSINTPTRAATLSEPFSFLSYNHRFNTEVDELWHGITEFIPMIQPIANFTPDFVFTGGDLSTVSDEGHAAYFLNFFGDTVSFPIVYVPGNYDEITKKLFSTQQQQFRIGQNLFVTMQPDADGAFTRDQKLFFYNILWQLEKQPDVKRVFFLSHRMGWIAGNPALEPMRQAVNQPLTENDSFYTLELLPRIAKYSDRKFYFVGGDLKPHPFKNVFSYTDGNIQYLASAVNNHDSDAYLQFSVANDSVTISAIDGQTHQLLGSIDSFGGGHWKNLLPETHTAQAKTSKSQQSDLLFPIASVLLGVLSGVGYALFVSGYRKLRK